MPCVHASWLPTRSAGQTTGSMISRLTPAKSAHWLTGTSSPCLSVFKPVLLGGAPLIASPPAGASWDPHSLFWRHELIHRLVLEDYERRAPLIIATRDPLEVEAFELERSPQAIWDEHRAQLPKWLERLQTVKRPAKGHALFRAYWAYQNRRERMPLR